MVFFFFDALKMDDYPLTKLRFGRKSFIEAALRAEPEYDSYPSDIDNSHAHRLAAAQNEPRGHQRTGLRLQKNSSRAEQSARVLCLDL